MSDRKAIVFGASGQVGHLLVEQLLKDEYFKIIRVIARRPYDLQDPKIEVKKIDFEMENALENAMDHADVIFCCLGTTMKAVKGNKALYRKIDFDIPVRAAKWGHEKGIRQFAFVSAVGADPRSGNFYLRLKGEVEKFLAEIPFESLHIMRPSLLLGKRTESRPAEKIFKVLMQPTPLLFIGKWKKYRPVQAADVAQAMIAAVKKFIPGKHVYHYDEMIGLISNPHQE